MKNKLLIILTFVGISSQTVKADGFFHSVGNVATLGELDRSEKRHESTVCRPRAARLRIFG